MNAQQQHYIGTFQNVTLTVALALGVLVLVAPAGATFPGTNGNIVFESSRLGPTKILAMDAVPGAQATLLPGNNDNNNMEAPTVSPDGSKIAYVYGRDIWVMNADGSGPRQLTNDANFNQEPAWSADGTKIAFSGGVSTGWDLFTMNADGTGRTNITNTPSIQEFAAVWSPDGSEIAYERGGCEPPNGGGTCVYKMNADGTGTPTNLTPETSLPECPLQPGYRHNGASDNPSWSPDGTKIAFEGTLICPSTSGSDIWVMNADGSGKINLINDSGTGDDNPAFSPDGQQIVFESDRDNLSGSTDELYTIPATGGTITRLITNSNFDDHADWQPIPVCTITGTAGNDVRSGTAGKDVICGLGGDDTLNGAGDNDIVLGGPGRDRLTGSLGNDILNGGPGVDTALYAGAAPARANLTTEFATGVGSDVLVGVENLSGSSMNDLLTGSATANSLIGGAGADRMRGLAGPDTLNSKDGMNRNDTLDGGTGTDRCITDANERSILSCP